MKNFGRNPILSFGGVLLAALWLLTAAAEAATPGAAQVKKVVGTATYTDARGNGPIKEGDILMQGATITTGAGSYVDLDMGINGNALRVEADSTLVLNKLDYTKAGETIVNTQLEVKKGAAVANVINKLSKASKYEIKTPAGVAGIRGTVLRAGATRIVCLIGRVEFRTVNGQLQLVIGGTAVTVGGGVVKAATVETTGLARTATSLTTNTQASGMVSNVVQQFTAALAAEAATEAGKAGGNSAAAAAQAAKAIMAELVQAVQEAAAQAPPAVRAAAQAAAANLAQKSEVVQATAAASAAAAATVANGGTVQQAKQAAQQAANQSTSNQTVANAAANNVTTGAINQAVQNRNQGGTQSSIIETVAENTRSAGGPRGPGQGGKGGPVQNTKTDTKIGETVIFVSPDTAGGTTTPRN
ncbi:MAG: cell wall surface anchor family protein [Limisphaerales bacterium]|nr:MAG: cell wall surface anchor family protein [Limisphaerales bacterium]KAG0509428.1 MAG: cell wall surface anchor family protein [Limisphaerales bacterium]TXT52265.1 MAG: cell wall surface anchor family protein [Limisphaerales bacterium]